MYLKVHTIRNYLKICHILGVEMPSEGRIDANRLFKKVIYIKIYIFKLKYKKDAVTVKIRKLL